ncbi:MAG: cadherin-like beta sandwich domain-containing protein [Clostridiales bacterium]|nr:cadherin-like beta sandwich domain-containing protein [Clostridiales bacterium]
MNKEWNCLEKRLAIAEAEVYPNSKFIGWHDEDEVLVSTDLVYRFRIERDIKLMAKFESLASVDNELSSLTVKGVTLEESFYYYLSATVPYDTSSVLVEATAINPNAIVVGTGEKALDVGENQIVIIVSALGKEQLMYDITINREQSDSSAPATPLPTFKVVNADTGGEIAAVTVLIGDAGTLETKFVVAAFLRLGKYLSPTRIAVDVPPLSEHEKSGLTGVVYDDNGVVAKRLGGELSEDKKTFVFYDINEKPEKPATYGLICEMNFV